jgi:glycosyltransferase involved in cell wall biosynthesis
MKIGVAIPAYNGHIELLFILLDSIQNQTILPDKVVVSCSSSDDTDFNNYNEKLKCYSFLLQIITNKEKKSAAQNRNTAASNLAEMDYITFIDADDVMHPQRIEILLKVFQENDSDIILHNFSEFTNDDQLFVKKFEDNEIVIRPNSLKQCYSGCIAMKEHYNTNEKIHHGHVSIKQNIFNIVQFPEEPEFYRKEDCVFCYRVFSLPNIKDSYVANQLTYYKPSNTQILYF